MSDNWELMSDNWEHRTDLMNCSSCMWFIPKLNDVGETSLGRCRKHAPTINGWPAVYKADWCGDHKLDENKVD